MREVRRLWVNLDDAVYIRDRLNFANCRIALRVDRELHPSEGEILQAESRHFVTSLDPDTVTPAELLATIRGHWQVETSHARQRV